MCGIAGFYNKEGCILGSEFNRVLQKEFSRGPDAYGSYFFNNVGLGHLRLKILDLSDKASQPMVDESLKLTLVFNGEIYNFKEIRNILIKKGYQFYSTSDSEVILKAYDAWGEDFVLKLQGMFAFALWDEKNKKLILVRDRLGIKPLYYAITPSGFKFASTLPALLEFNGIDKSIDKLAVHFYLTFHAIPEPLTIVNGIKKLKPGTMLIVNENNSIEQKPYWQFILNEKGVNHALQENDWLDKTYDALYQATKRQLYADVPVGILLSGGLDSSLLVAMAHQFNDKLETFSIGFESTNEVLGDEFYYSNLIAKHFNTNHHQLIISNKKLLSSLESCVLAMSEPMMSHDNIGFYLLAQEVSKYVKVALSGQGADEIFAGYQWFLSDANALPLANISEIILNQLADFNYQEYEKIITSEYKMPNIAKTFLTEMAFNNGSTDILDNLLLYESTYGLSNGPLSRIDNMTMASSLEARVPFLDELVIEMALSMPQKYKVPNNGKYILKKIAQKILPKEIINRPKGYFPVPTLKYPEGQTLDLIKTILAPEAILKRGIFNLKEVQNLINSGNKNLTPTGGSKLWQIALLEYWLQLHGL